VTYPSSLRCSACSVNWPPADDYEECPRCGGETWPTAQAEPIDAAEANRALQISRFEKQYGPMEVT
jgi:hypothetical protein